MDFFLDGCSSFLLAPSSCAPDNRNNGRLSHTDAPSSDMSDASDALDDFRDEARDPVPATPPMPLIDMPLTCRNDDNRDCQPPGLDDCVSEHKSAMSFFRLNTTYTMSPVIGSFFQSEIPNFFSRPTRRAHAGTYRVRR